jgi:hypothetical protein
LMLTDINSCMPYRFLNFCAHWNFTLLLCRSQQRLEFICR